MADLDYTIGVRTDQAERNIDRLKKSVGGLSTAFSSFRNVIGGLAIGGLITNTIRWADSIQDVADSTGIATATILGFSQAVVEAGGTSEGANNALVKFNQTLGEAQQGSKSAQAAFANLGITVDELKSLSSEAIFNKTLAGLRDINSLSRQAAASADVFAKTLKGVDLRGVATNTGVYAESNVEVAKSVKAAADAQQQFESAMLNFKKVLLVVIQPVTEFLSQVDVTTDNIRELAKEIQNYAKIAAVIALVIASFTIFGRVAALLGGILRGLGVIFESLQLFLLNISIRMGSLGKIGQTLSDIFAKVATSFGKIIDKSPKLGNNLQWIIEKWRGLAAAVVGAIAAYKLFSDTEIEPIPYDQGGPQGGRRVSAEVLAQIATERAEREKAATEEAKKAQETALLKIKASQELMKAARDEGLEHFRNNLILEDEARKAEVLRNLFADIALINREIADKTGLEQLATQNELIGLYGREYEAKAEILAIDAERQNAINDALANLRSMGATATSEDVERARREIELAQYVADERLKIFQDRVAKETAIEQSAVAGVKAALQEITQAVTPFNVAQESILVLFDGMKQGITDFATTGKLNFKTFALSLIRDLLMVQAQAAFRQLFGMGGNFLAALFGGGKAAGGPVKGNTAYVVGEKGPELFVPKSAGTIVPNNKMNSGSGQAAPANNTYNTYNISAIDSQSVAQFFAQNRKMALGAVTMAQKELSYGS